MSAEIEKMGTLDDPIHVANALTRFLGGPPRGDKPYMSAAISLLRRQSERINDLERELSRRNQLSEEGAPKK